MSSARASSTPLPPLPRTGPLYLAMLGLLAIGFYLLLLASLIAYGAAFYLLALAVPSLFAHPSYATLRFGIPMLLGSFGALVIFSIAVIRGIFARSGGTPTGIQAHRAHHQAVFTAVREVADKVGSRPLDEIILTPGPEIGVREDAALYLPPGMGKRRIVLGMAALSSMTTDQLKAVLAHEFGHFSNRDTFFSRFVYRVHLTYGAVLDEMQSVRLFFLNPVFWLLTGYMWIYGAISASLSRLAEFRADRFAVEAFGREIFAEALVVAHLEGSFFMEVGLPTILQGVQQRRRYDNIYHHLGLLRREFVEGNPGYARKVLGDILTARTGALDSHPSLGERLRRQNVATALLSLPPLPRLISSAGLDQTVPPALTGTVRSGPPSAAEELLGPGALRLQGDLSRMAADDLVVMVEHARSRRAAALDA